MSTRTVVIVQEDSTTSGKVSEFEDTQEAEHFIEGLLQAGFEQRSIKVLTMRKLELVVTHRPAVSLIPAHPVRADRRAAESVPVIEDFDVESLWAPTGDGAAMEVLVPAAFRK